MFVSVQGKMCNVIQETQNVGYISCLFLLVYMWQKIALFNEQIKSE